MLKRHHDIIVDGVTINMSTLQTGLIYFFVANLLNWLLYGMLTVQLYLYYLAFPNDKKWTKASVYTVYFLETIQAIGIVIVLAYGVTGDNAIFANPSVATGAIPFSLKPIVYTALIDLVGGIVPLIAQFLYAHRIQIITRSKVTPIIIRALAILQLFSILSYASSSSIFYSCWTSLNAANDLIIAFTMTRGLLRGRVLSQYTRLKIIRLVYLIVATGSLTALFNFIALATFIFSFVNSPSPTVYALVAVSIFMPKLYANSILVVLNSRMKISNSRNATSNGQSAQVLSALVIAESRPTIASDIVTDVGTAH